MKISEIDTSKLKGFENVNLEKLLLVYLEFPKTNLNKIKYVKLYVNSRFQDRFSYCYKKENNNNKVAILSDLYYRDDYLDVFLKFIKKFEDFDYIIPTRKKRINILRGLKMIISDLNLWKTIKKIDLDKQQKQWLLYKMGLIKLFSNRIIRMIGKKKYTNLLVFNDSCPYENMLVQKMKNEWGVHTATLQHGLFDVKGKCKGIEYRASVADDFLAWNEMTRELALEAHLTNVKVLGIPRYIEMPTITRNNDNIFCVVLSGRICHKENLELIKISNKVALENNIKYYIRRHPADIDDLYYETANKMCIKEEFNESIVEMCERTNFCLVGADTSMIIDLIFLGQKFYEYNSQSQKYRRNTFCNFYDLISLIDTDYWALLDDEAFVYYCSTKDVYESYKSYFQQSDKLGVIK